MNATTIDNIVDLSPSQFFIYQSILSPLSILPVTLLPSFPSRRLRPLHILTLLTTLLYRWLGSRVVSVLDSGAEGPGSNRSRDAVG